MKRSQCKDGLEIYKRFLTRMTRVSDFFKIAEVDSRPHFFAQQLLKVVLVDSNGSLSFHSKWG